MSDFGLLPGRRAAAMELIDSFAPSYVFKQTRIAGDELRTLHAHPGRWQV